MVCARNKLQKFGNFIHFADIYNDGLPCYRRGRCMWTSNSEQRTNNGKNHSLTSSHVHIWTDWKKCSKYRKWAKWQFQLQINWKLIILIYIYYSQQTLFIILKSTVGWIGAVSFFPLASKCDGSFLSTVVVVAVGCRVAVWKPWSKINYDESYYALNFGYIKFVRSNHASN